MAELHVLHEDSIQINRFHAHASLWNDNIVFVEMSQTDLDGGHKDLTIKLSQEQLEELISILESMRN